MSETFLKDFIAVDNLPSQSRSHLSKDEGGGGNQAEWVWQPYLYVKKVIKHKERRSLGALITNFFINAMYPLPFIIP